MIKIQMTVYYQIIKKLISKYLYLKKYLIYIYRMDSIKEIKVGRPLSLGIPRTKDEINLYAKNYYHLKGRQLIRCECCDTEVVKSNFLKHTRTKVHLKNDLIKTKEINI